MLLLGLIKRGETMYISLLTLIGWVAAITMIGTIMTIVDKQRAQQHRYRIPERRLMLMGILGGAWMMWITMLLIHHKTRRKKFMIGFPLIVAAQVALFMILWENGQYFIFVW